MNMLVAKERSFIPAVLWNSVFQTVLLLEEYCLVQAVVDQEVLESADILAIAAIQAHLALQDNLDAVAIQAVQASQALAAILVWMAHLVQVAAVAIQAVQASQALAAILVWMACQVIQEPVA
jgi:hypothetical protein